MDLSMEPDAAAQDLSQDPESVAQDIASQVMDTTSKWFQKSGTDSANE